jgi:hypothetical protein
MKKYMFGIIMCVAALIAGILGISRSSVNATDEAAINQKNEEAFVQYVKDNLVDKSSDVNAFYSEDGDMDKLVEDLDEDEIYEIGDNIIISNDEVSQYEKFFSLNGDDNAQESAEEYARERNALYVAALENGFEVTEQEIFDYLDKLKEEIKSTLTAEEYRNLYTSYGTEEEYWDYEFEVYKINLPIQNYVSSLENQYKEAYSATDSIVLEQMWTEEYENIKKTLVDEQNFVTLDEY